MEIKDKNIASDVKKIKKMTENIKEPIADDIGDSQDNIDQSTEPVNPFEQIMNNSEIGKIAQEVSKSLITIPSILAPTFWIFFIEDIKAKVLDESDLIIKRL